MRRKIPGFLLLAALSFLLWTQTSISQTSPSATLTLHDFQVSTTDSVAGIDLDANTDITAIKVWVDQDSCDFDLGSALDANWAIAEEYEASGQTFVHAVTYNTASAVRSGHVLNVTYTGTDTLGLASNSVVQYFYGGYRTNVTTTVSGTATATTVPVVTFTLHSNIAHGQGGIDLSSTGPIDGMFFIIDYPLGQFRYSLGDSLPSTWYIRGQGYYPLSTPSDETTPWTYIDIATTNPDSAVSSGHVLNLRYAGPDTLLFYTGGESQSYATFYDAGCPCSIGIPVTTDSFMTSDVDSFLVQGAHPGVMFGFDKGHSGVYPAVFPDTVQQKWAVSGFEIGAPVFHIGDYVITTSGTYANGNPAYYDSATVDCRIDTTGVLVWSTTISDTMMNYNGYTWPMGAWMGADSLVYVTRSKPYTDQVGRIYALNLDNGTVAWTATHDSLVTAAANRPNASLIMDDGDFVALDFDPTGGGISRFDGPDGSLVWVTQPAGALASGWLSSSGFATAIMAYTWDATEYIAVPNVVNKMVVMRASDGVEQTANDMMLPYNGLEPIYMVSNAALTDSVTPKQTIIYSTSPLVEWRSWRTGHFAGTSFYQLSLSSGDYQEIQGNSFIAWLTPSITDSLYVGPLAIFPTMSTTIKFIAGSIPGYGGSSGFRYNRTLFSTGSEKPTFTIATDQSRNVIVAVRGEAAGSSGIVSMYSDVVDQTPVEGTQTSATHEWSIPLPNASCMTAIAADGGLIWMNFNGVLVCYEQYATGPRYSRPPGEVVTEP